MNASRACNSVKTKIRGLDSASGLAHRLRRALSWLERAVAEDDTDVKYIVLWVSFNAAYAIERRTETAKHQRSLKEWERRKLYFETLTPVGFRRIHRAIREEIRDPVDRLMCNEYIFSGFWEDLTEHPFDWENWPNRQRFEDDRDTVRRRLRFASIDNTTIILRRVFDRLNVLRNQLMHGCATREGSLNRRQVEDGAEILGVLVPIFLNTMADHPEEDWGAISYPVRDDIREDRRTARESHRPETGHET